MQVSPVGVQDTPGGGWATRTWSFLKHFIPVGKNASWLPATPNWVVIVVASLWKKTKNTDKSVGVRLRERMHECARAARPHAYQLRPSIINSVPISSAPSFFHARHERARAERPHADAPVENRFPRILYNNKNCMKTFLVMKFTTRILECC